MIAFFFKLQKEFPEVKITWYSQFDLKTVGHSKQLFSHKPLNSKNTQITI